MTPPRGRSWPCATTPAGCRSPASEGADTARLEAEQAQLEDRVRRLRHQATGSSAAGTAGPEVDRLVEATADTAFVELVEVGDALHALVVTGGRVRRLAVGPVAAAVQALTYAHFTLRQAARGRPAQVGAAGERLQRTLLGPVAAALPVGPVVISPTSRFHAVPWGLLPALAERPVTTVPSAGLWLRARSTPAPRERRDRPRGRARPRERRRGGAGPRRADARCACCWAAAPRASTPPWPRWTAPGSPTWPRTVTSARTARCSPRSALDDGPLVVHDFERLERAPYRVVLSACESGVMKPVGAGELLGLGAALLSLGTAGVVSSVAVVNDEATVEVMVALHARLHEGAGLAEALLAARTATAHDATLAATAASFTAMGV